MVFQLICLSAQHLQKAAQQGGRRHILRHGREVDPDRVDIAGLCSRDE